MLPADRLRQIAIGFQQAKILLAAAELRLFDRLGGEGASATTLAGALCADTRALEVLLDALTAMEILDKRDGRYRMRGEYTPLLRDDGPTHQVAMLRHMNRLFRRWAFLEERVLGRGVPDLPGLEKRPSDHESFIRAMFAASHQQAAAISQRLPLDGATRVADLGGGPGHYLAATLDRAPAVEGFLVDLPETLEIARRVQAANPRFGDVRFVAWDMYRDEPPDRLRGLDLAFLSQVVHSEPPEANARLFLQIATLLSPGGRLVVHEQVLDPGRTTPAETTVFAVNMLAMTEAGRCYTEDEITSWATSAGLVKEAAERLSTRSFLLQFRRPPRG